MSSAYMDSLIWNQLQFFVVGPIPLSPATRYMFNFFSPHKFSETYGVERYTRILLKTKFVKYLMLIGW